MYEIGIDELIRERDKLQRRLELINVRCDGRDRLVAKIHRINIEIVERGVQSA